MTCLTWLINDLSKAHTTNRGKGCGHREMQAGRGMKASAESECNVEAPDGVSDRCDHHWELRYTCDTLTAQCVIFQL